MEQLHDRRSFMKIAAGAGAAAALAGVARSPLSAQEAAAARKSIAMTALPYAENALEPYVSSRTVHLHYNKHHKGFYDTLKAYIDTHAEYQNLSLEELIIKNKGGILLDDTIFYVSVLLHNHNHYWRSLMPKSGGMPKGKIGKLLAASYGTYDAFRAAFIGEAMKIGAGWVWVVLDGEKLKAYRTEYHDTPLVKGFKPLLAIDVWEHAYYLDYQDERGKYVEAVLNNLLNWEYAETLLAPPKK